MPVFQQTLDELLVRFLTFLPNLVAAVIISLLSLYISAWLGKAAGRAARQRRAGPEVQLLLERLTRWAVLIVGIIAALDQVHFQVTSLIAGLGIAGFTIGFALQDVAKNFVAGTLLLLQQPFDIGDTIEVSGFTGTVQDVTLRSTQLTTVDGRYVVIPNGDVFVSSIVNYSRSLRRRLEFTAGIEAGADAEKATRVALEALRNVPGVLPDPAPTVVYSRLKDSAVEATAQFWIDMQESDYLASQDAGIKAVLAAFEREGVPMSTPSMTVRMAEG